MLDARLTGFELRPVRHKARFEDDPIDFRQTPAGREILQNAPAAGAPHPTGEFGVWINRAENRALIDRARMQYAALERDKEQRNRQAMPIWHQLVVNSVTAVIVRPTRVDVDPFDDDPGGQYRCPLGHLLGLNLLSELSIRAVSTTETDFVVPAGSSACVEAICDPGVSFLHRLKCIACSRLSASKVPISRWPIFFERPANSLSRCCRQAELDQKRVRITSSLPFLTLEADCIVPQHVTRL